jgi:hypothetical protein
MDPADVLAIGRVTYLVEARHVLTHATLWNMTFSRWQPMPSAGSMFQDQPLLNIGEGARSHPTHAYAPRQSRKWVRARVHRERLG